MIIQFHHLAGQKLEFQVEKLGIVIGRSSSCDVILPFEGLSRQHCRLDLEEGKVFITDLGSINGVFIDGIRIEPHIKTEYNFLFPLMIGPADVSIVIQAADLPPEPVTPGGIPVHQEIHQRPASNKSQAKPFKVGSRLSNVDWKLMVAFFVIIGGFLLFQRIKNNFDGQSLTEEAYYHQFNNKLKERGKDGSVITRDL
ncbi:MAG: FHA domain-containing protein [Bacteriovoracia bacterium]